MLTISSGGTVIFSRDLFFSELFKDFLKALVMFIQLLIML
jgi:hypothetical protein